LSSSDGVVFGDFAIYGLLDSIVNDLRVFTFTAKGKARAFTLEALGVKFDSIMAIALRIRFLPYQTLEQFSVEVKCRLEE
jgi:hypothetical protein